jgi:predicted transcriptional regulator
MAGGGSFVKIPLNPKDKLSYRLAFAQVLHLALEDGLPRCWLKKRLGLWVYDTQIPTIQKIMSVGGIDPLLKLWSEWQEVERSVLRALRKKNPRRISNLAVAIQRDKHTTLQAVKSLQKKGLVTYEEWPWKVVRLTEKGRREARML